MSSCVGGDDTEIISIGKGDEPFTTDIIGGFIRILEIELSDEVVARIDVIEEEGEDRIECEEERDWTQGISLEDSPFEREWI